MNEDIYLYNDDGSIKYDQKQYDFCIKNNLWTGFARIRKDEADRESSMRVRITRGRVFIKT